MAIFTTGAIIGSISGKLGGLVFVNGKKQGVVRPRPGSPRNRSERQVNALSRFCDLQRAWADLSDDQRLTWAVTARGTQIANRLGKASPPGPFQLFVKENAKLQLGPGTLIEEPPVRPISEPPRLVVVDFEASGNYNVQANPGEGAASAIFYVYGWTQCKTYFTNTPPKFVHMLTVGAASLDRNIQTEWGAIFGPLAEDQVFTVAVSERTASNFMSTQVIVRGVTTA